MAQNVVINGVTYQNVPEVDIPKTGGGTATFTDVTDTTATASDVATGTYFYTAAGVKTQGTNSGGGGTSKNTQVVQGTTRTNSSTATAIGADIIIIAIVVVMILKKNGRNDDESEEGVEMDLYEVEIGKGKKGKLEIKQTLYDNATTIVYKGIMNNSIDVVVKIMKMWGTKLDSSQSREMELMRKLKSDYIVEYYGTSVIEGRLGIVMEFIPLGSLEGLMSKKVLSPELKIRYVREICYGMRYLHSMNIIHRPQNWCRRTVPSW